MSDFKLYEINEMLNSALSEVWKLAEQNEGEIPEDWSKFLDEIQMERDKKCLDVARYIKSLNAEESAISNEIKSLTERKKTATNKAERLKEYLRISIKEGEKLNDANTVISWRKSSKTIIDNENELPETCFKIEKNPVLTEIKSLLESGKITSGAHIELSQNIQIK